MVNYYPEDGCTYEFVDRFLEQTTAVNTNTTVSVSIDGGPLIPLAFEGVRNEAVPPDSVVRNWYTWQATVPAITRPGNHTFQFFSHYYVWQDADKYWAEFNAQSEVKSFTIAGYLPSSQSQPAMANQIFILACVAASSVAVLWLIASLFPRKTTGARLRA
jgi:hypothetical protein